MTSSHNTPTRGYRRDIDGLRAIAILPVVLYHYGLSGFSGGFVGVDVFFVISGFLIGGLLWAELNETGRIRLLPFFGRRIRRLAPAYLAMAVATSIAAWFILMPFDFREFGQELVAATVYLANVHFFREAGYFDTASDQKLLLHTWSLSVEEQFYLFVPVFMLLLARLRRILPILLVGLGVLSFVACLALMQLSPTAAFYLFPFRAWEMMAGVVLAIWGQQRQTNWDIHPALSWVGLGLIAVAVFTFQAGDHFPGLWALAPVVGTVLILLNGRQDNPINQLLSSAPFLFFGLISYSLYLWHWPMVTLLKYYLGVTQLDLGMIAVLLGVSIGVAWLSYKLVETPIRKGALPQWRLPVGYALASAGVIGAALSFAFSDGRPERFAPEARPFIAAARDFHRNFTRCSTPSDGPWAGIEICAIGPDGPPEVLVWGDSHARAFKGGVDQAASDAGVPGLLIWRGGCPPLLGVMKDERVSTLAEEQACAQSGDLVQTGLAQTPSIHSVLLIGRWAYYAEGVGVGIDDHNWVTLSSTDGTPAPDQKTLFSTALSQTVQTLDTATDRVFVLRQMPEMALFRARNAARDVAYGHQSADTLLATQGRIDRNQVQTTRSAAADAAVRAAVTPEHMIDLWDQICTETECSMQSGNDLLYYDNNHVSDTGARLLRDGFASVFTKD